MAELTVSKADVQRLRERLTVRTHTVHKDLSLISLVPKWSVSESAFHLEEFIPSIEVLAKVGRCQDFNCL
jgi:hypothetical protein